jgi:signal transduction histidine kinase
MTQRQPPVKPLDFTSETIAYAREMRALYRAAEQRAVRFRLLVEVGRDLASVRDSGALLALALTRATTFSGFSDGCVLLLAGGALEVRATVGQGLSGGGPALADAERALGAGQAVVTAGGDGCGNDESRIALPLIPGDGQPLGVLLLAGVDVARPPDADDLDALQLLAGQLAAALQGTQLHEENTRLVARLTEREHRLAELVDLLMRAQEEERRRVAYEVHDGLAQMAAGVLQQLHTLADRYRPRAPRSRQALGRAVEMAQATVAEARRVIAGLRPTVLDDFGLDTGLRLLAVGLRSDGWDVTYESQLGAERLSPAAETALYRVGQELLTNVRKHAGPTRVLVALAREGDEAALLVRDWGVGFAAGERAGPSHDGAHVGLAGIAERVSAFGGRLRLESAPGQGTLVEVRLPVLGARQRGADTRRAGEPV